MINWRPFPQSEDERLGPWSGDDFLLALPTLSWFGDPGLGDHDAYFVLTAHWEKSDHCFYARNAEWLDVEFRVIPENSFWSEINLPSQIG